MTFRSFLYGHPISTGEPEICLKSQTIRYTHWFYNDTGEDTETAPRRACPRCNQPPSPEGHDPCLGTLPGVTAACCGHGVEPGYVMFSNDLVIRGDFTVDAKDKEAGK